MFFRQKIRKVVHCDDWISPAFYGKKTSFMAKRRVRLWRKTVTKTLVTHVSAVLQQISFWPHQYKIEVARIKNMKFDTNTTHENIRHTR